MMTGIVTIQIVTIQIVTIIMFCNCFNWDVELIVLQQAGTKRVRFVILIYKSENVNFFIKAIFCRTFFDLV